MRYVPVLDTPFHSLSTTPFSISSCVDLFRLNGAAVYHEPTSQYCVLFRLLSMHANAFFLPLSSHSLFHSFLKHQLIAHPHPYPHPHSHLYPHSTVSLFLGSIQQIFNDKIHYMSKTLKLSFNRIKSNTSII